MSVQADTGYLNVLSSTGALLYRFNLGEWRDIHFFDPSPDGRSIVVSISKFDGGKAVLAVVHRDGTGLTLLSDSVQFPTGVLRGAFCPTWSPDGSRIAFLRLYIYPPPDSQKVVLLTVDPDGSDSVALTEATRLNVPLWSPDGHKIACFQDPYLYFQDGPIVVRLVHVDTRTTEQIVLADNVFNTDNKTMSWGVNGTLFCSVDSPDSNGIHAIYRVSNTGAQQISGSFLRSQIACSPDGQYLAILGNRRSEPFSLYIMRPDGSDLRLIKRLSSVPATGIYAGQFPIWL
jgi:Tol biopolymer transport system component